jgi:hypothetical protein
MNSGPAQGRMLPHHAIGVSQCGRHRRRQFRQTTELRQQPYCGMRHETIAISNTVTRGSAAQLRLCRMILFMAKGGYLRHPYFLRSAPFVNPLSAGLRRQRLSETLVDGPNNDPNLSVTLRVFNLQRLFENRHNLLVSCGGEAVSPI